MSGYIIVPFGPIGMVQLGEAAFLVDEYKVHGERGTVGSHLSENDDVLTERDCMISIFDNGVSLEGFLIGMRGYAF